MKDIAELIRAISTLLWPILVLSVVLIFRQELGELLSQFKRMKRGKLFGQEVEFNDTLVQDETSVILTNYVFPGGAYNEERTRELNDMLRELAVERDVRTMLDGAQGAALRGQLIRYARAKGVALDSPPADSASGAG
jgi:hypothetical protein